MARSRPLTSRTDAARRLSWTERGSPAHGVRVGVVDVGVSENAFALPPPRAWCGEGVFHLQ